MVKEPSDDFQNIIDYVLKLSNIEERSGLSILRSEARLLALIKREPGNSVKYYLSKSELSPRWFYKVLSVLTSTDLVSEAANPQDLRQKILS